MMVTAGVTIVADTAEAIKSPVKCDFVSCLIVKVSVHIRGYGDPYSIYIYIFGNDSDSHAANKCISGQIPKPTEV